jgi:hypothetical protein
MPWKEQNGDKELPCECWRYRRNTRISRLSIKRVRLAVTVYAWSGTWIVCAHSATEFVGSILTRGMKFCIMCLCYPVCRQRPCNGLLHHPRSPTVYSIKKLKTRPRPNNQLYSHNNNNNNNNKLGLDRLCGLAVRVLGYRSGGPGSIPSTTRKKKVVGLERGPLSLVSTTEELLDRKVEAPV